MELNLKEEILFSINLYPNKDIFKVKLMRNKKYKIKNKVKIKIKNQKSNQNNKKMKNKINKMDNLMRHKIK